MRERDASFTDVWLKLLVKNVESAFRAPPLWDSRLLGEGSRVLLWDGVGWGGGRDSARESREAHRPARPLQRTPDRGRRAS